MAKYVIHFEFDGVNSSLARKAANAAWRAAEDVVGEAAIAGSAERRSSDGAEPEWTGWRDWAEESTTTYRRVQS